MAIQKTTVKELMKMDIDIDVYDNVGDYVSIAFCGPCKLTAEGKRVFAEMMDWTVEIVERGYERYAIVDIDGPEGVWQKKAKLAKLFFNGFAGYISDERWNQLFKEV